MNLKKISVMIVLIQILYTNSIDASSCIQNIGNITGENPGDRAGASVALSSNGMILAEGEFTFNSNAGRVRIFSYDGNSWNNIGAITGENSNDQAGIHVALSSNGKILAEGEIGFNSNAGRVRIFSYDGSSWNNIGSITGETSGDRAGINVALSSNGMILAEGEFTFNSNAGQVRIFSYDGSSWNNIGSITGETSGDRAGRYVALSSDGKILAEAEIGFDNNTGRVRIFSYDGNSWNNIGLITGTDGSTISRLPVSLNSEGNIIAIGNDAFDNAAGQVQIFSYDGSSWNNIGSITGENPSDLAGASVVINSCGNVFAEGELGFGAKGRTRTFLHTQNSWLEIGSITGEESGDLAGISVALKGNVIAVGEIGVGSNNGRVRIFHNACIPDPCAPLAPREEHFFTFSQNSYAIGTKPGSYYEKTAVDRYLISLTK